MEDVLISESTAKRLPIWINACILAVTASAVATAVTLALTAGQINTKIGNAAMEVEDVFSGIDTPALTKAIQQFVFLVDLACKEFVECPAAMEL